MINKLHIAIVGSRGFRNYDLLCDVIDEYLRSTIDPYDIDIVIVSGGAQGADTLAEKYASEHNMQVSIHKADWKKYGRAAGMIRNKDIINEADVVFAFWDGKSKGTKHSIKLAKKANKEVQVLGYNVNG